MSSTIEDFLCAADDPMDLIGLEVYLINSGSARVTSIEYSNFLYSGCDCPQEWCIRFNTCIKIHFNVYQDTLIFEYYTCTYKCRAAKIVSNLKYTYKELL